MGVPSIVTFEVEVVELNSKKTLRRFEKLRQSFRGKSSKVAKFPSLGLSHQGIATAYPHRNRSSILRMSPPFQFIGNTYNEGEKVTTTKKQGGSIWTEAHHNIASCVGR